MTENIENNGCSQRDSAEHEGYAKASRSFNRIWKERDSVQPRLLEAILYKDNFNRKRITKYQNISSSFFRHSSQASGLRSSSASDGPLPPWPSQSVRSIRHSFLF